MQYMLLIYGNDTEWDRHANDHERCGHDVRDE